MLFSSEGSGVSAGHGASGCLCDGLEHRSYSLLPDWEESALVPLGGACAHVQQVLCQQEEAQAVLAAALASAKPPASPGRMVAVIPADSVPAPPYSSALGRAEPPQSAADPEATAAMPRQQLQLAVAQCPQWLDPVAGPFAFCSAGSSTAGAASLPASTSLL